MLVRLKYSPMRKDSLSYIKQKTPNSVNWTQLVFTKVMKCCKCSIIVNILTIGQMQSCNVEWNIKVLLILNEFKVVG